MPHIERLDIANANSEVDTQHLIQNALNEYRNGKYNPKIVFDQKPHQNEARNSNKHKLIQPLAAQ